MIFRFYEPNQIICITDNRKKYSDIKFESLDGIAKITPTVQVYNARPETVLEMIEAFDIAVKGRISAVILPVKVIRHFAQR